MKKDLYRKIPKVDSMIEKEEFKTYLNKIDQKIVVGIIRKHLDDIRSEISRTDDLKTLESRVENIDNDIIDKLEDLYRSNLRRVINCTGVVVHTNLGRSVFSEEIFNEIKDVLTHYTNLEYDLSKGERGSRYDIVEDVICLLTGAEAALVVNNNAAAVILALNTLSSGREAIVSRGELVEIGGSFRVPEVMRMGGAQLVEVGTTNRTHLEDFENAIGENTGVILKVHTSNYKVIGFSKSVDSADLVKLGREKGMIVMEDLGSGTMVDLSKFGITYEPTVHECVRKGLDIVTFSGDKLLGGPQAGIILGKKELIDKMKKNQLTRALRVDKFTLASLESIFRKYLLESKALKDIPTLRMIIQTEEEIKLKAEKLYNMIKEKNPHANIKIEKCNSKIGGGSLPEELLDSYAVALYPEKTNAARIDRDFRNLEIPIVARINEDRVILDMRTVLDDDYEIIAEEVNRILK
ncbi:L-seryl-tRNA(Sec) selenium transferase [Dethiosulfatibacter aminovorans DSM 17477]|uniref:L-seryl-tRNA(Sec) selenium transferase n=1 Tax=Dethiosulfatibacter aminovorans DSM 17477 TaxID=1121476 RepID=A0A1M6CYY6_9FIRM|nr:L-seryl-tRNA(Sec) selenium transferase [Dethiosulfatibacter aminovorans]SHI66179.1 L-seryl-tRNA(Sec) selenium transferase [Dethiosulfatibacter aminovorans DSM 17477]